MLTIRNFKPSNNEYEEVVRVHNLERPDRPMTAADAILGDKNRDPKDPFQRFVAEQDGKMIAEGTYFDPTWSFAPGHFFLGWSVDPAYAAYTEAGQGIHQLIFDYAMGQLADLNPQTIVISAREDKTEKVQFLLDNGFELEHTPALLVLDLDAFDFAPYVESPSKIARNGIEIHTLADLKQSDPNWLNKIYELCCDLEQDVPQPDPPTKQSLDEWKKRFDSPNHLDKGWFVALDTNIDESNYQDSDGCGNYVGVSMLLTNEAKPEIMNTWLTGVVRTHRRKGIATAMKLQAFELAQSRNVKRIDTGNEENSPMYDLNLQLGFKPQPAWVQYEKTLA